MRRKLASMLGLLGFAVMAVISAVKSAAFSTALGRCIVAAVAMCLVGYVAGFVAEKALEEAVDARIPLYPEPDLQKLTVSTDDSKEEDK